MQESVPVNASIGGHIVRKLSMEYARVYPDLSLPPPEQIHIMAFALCPYPSFYFARFVFRYVLQIFDEDTGRWRLIKGTGEIIERIVSRKEQQEIQQHASRWGWDHKTLSQGEASSSGGVGIGGAWVRGKN